MVVLGIAAALKPIEAWLEPVGEEIHEPIAEANEALRSSTLDVVPLRIGVVFFRTIWTADPPNGGIGPLGIFSRIASGAAAAYGRFDAQPLYGKILFVLALLLAMGISADTCFGSSSSDSGWLALVLFIALSIGIASLVALVFWAILWGLSSLLLVGVVVAARYGINVVEHYVVEPLDHKVAAWLGLSEPQGAHAGDERPERVARGGAE